jgi:N-carbamoylputrescine amidase
MLVGHVYWRQVAPDCFVPGTATIWDYVDADDDEDRTEFSAELVAPEGAAAVTVRCTLRWTARGAVVWSEPEVEDLGVWVARPPVRVAVATGLEEMTNGSPSSLQHCVDRYAGLAQKACGDMGAELVALPEICLQWNLPEHPYDCAIEVPGPETDRFAEIARAHGAVIVVGLLERSSDAVYNSAVVIDGDGQMAGVYRKVHLASTEAMSGVLPGDGFPVMETRVGRLGCTICMDSSAAESARMVGLNGADFLVLPIMGDHRASRWTPGTPHLDEDRWRCIQRTRAMDNQLCMVIARNRGRGSCVIDRSGEVLAYNDGNQDLVVADVARDDGYRKWNGGCFRQVNWRQRRPHLYGAYTQEQPEVTRNLTVRDLASGRRPGT